MLGVMNTSITRGCAATFRIIEMNSESMLLNRL